MEIESDFQLDDVCLLKAVRLTGDIDKLVPHADSQQTYGLLCTFAEAISLQIELTGRDDKNAAILAWNYQWLFIFLSVFGECALYWPFQSSDCIKTSKNYRIRTANYFISNRIFGAPRVFTQDELKQCSAIWPKFYSMLDKPEFSHAASIAATNFNEPKLSVRISAVWSAIESLLGFDRDLRFKIAVMCSKILETDIDRRQQRFKEIKKLYDLRSKFVHGSAKGNKNDELGVRASLGLLRELLLFFAERGDLYSQEERDLLFLQ